MIARRAILDVPRDWSATSAGFGVCRATAYRYLAEGTEVLLAQAHLHAWCCAQRHDIPGALYWAASQLNLPTLADSG